jgi:hypothetical protein
MPENDQIQPNETIRAVARPPGYKRHRDLEAFGTSVARVFRMNFLEVLGHLKQVETDWILAMEPRRLGG